MAGARVPGAALMGISRRWVRKRSSLSSIRSYGSAMSSAKDSSRTSRGSTDSRSATVRGTKARASGSGCRWVGSTMYSPSQVEITCRNWSWLRSCCSTRIWPIGRAFPLSRSSCWVCKLLASAAGVISPACSSASPKWRALPIAGCGVESSIHKASVLGGWMHWGSESSVSLG